MYPSNRRARARLIVIGLVLVFSAPLFADDLPFQPGTQWALPSTATDLRWVEIRDVERTAAGTVYHISVLARKRGAAVGNIRHLVPHIAITAAALQQSVTKALPQERQSYPETYDESHQKWLAILQEEGHAPICETSVTTCGKL